MKPDLSHDEVFAELDALAFDLLDPTRRDAALAHVEHCDICRPALDSLRAAVAELALAAPPAAISEASRARVRDRLVTRTGGDARNGPAPPAPPVPLIPSQATNASPLVFPRQTSSAGTRRTWRTAEWLALAATVLFVATLGMLALSYGDQAELGASARSSLGQVEQQRQIADSLSAVVASRDSLIAGLVGRNVAVMTLTSAVAKEPFARMFWDRFTNTWTLIAQNMPDLKPGRTYQLWLMTPTGKISAGTFATHGGNAVVRSTYALGDNTLEGIAVTEEPAGGAPQPTGEIVIAASAK